MNRMSAQRNSGLKMSTSTPRLHRAKLRALNGIFETYRELLLEGYSEYEVRYPEADSELLAEVAAVYAVNHKQYFQGQREGWTQKGWRIPSLKFAWHIGGDYFNLIKWRHLLNIGFNAS